MQTVRWEFYPLVAHNSVTRAFIEELAQVRRSSSTIDNYSRDLEDFLQAFTDLPFSAVLEADESQIARYVDGLWSRPARRGSVDPPQVTTSDADPSDGQWSGAV